MEDCKARWNERQDKQRNFRDGLKSTLKGLLNNDHLDYEAIVLNGAMHGMGSHTAATELLLLIWSVFFGGEDWRDKEFVDESPTIVDNQF